jgi:hypothetical protein
VIGDAGERTLPHPANAGMEVLMQPELFSSWQGLHAHYFSAEILDRTGIELHEATVREYNTWPYEQKVKRAQNIGTSGAVGPPLHLSSPYLQLPHAPANAAGVRVIQFGSYGVRRNRQAQNKSVSDVALVAGPEGQPFILQACIRAALQGHVPDMLGVAWSTMCEETVFADVFPACVWTQREIKTFVIEGGSDIVTREIRAAKVIQAYSDALRHPDFAHQGLTHQQYLWGVLQLLREACPNATVCNFVHSKLCTCVVCLFQAFTEQ